MQKRQFSEASLTIAVADYLRGEIHKGRNVIQVNVPFPGLLWTFVANEGRSLEQGSKFKRFGVKRGCSDFLLWYAGKTFAIELKTPDGTQSVYQRDFMLKFQREGGQYAICRSVVTVRDTLIRWGIKCENPVCYEPAPTFEEKREFSHAMYAPIPKL